TYFSPCIQSQPPQRRFVALFLSHWAAGNVLVGGKEEECDPAQGDGLVAGQFYTSPAPFSLQLSRNRSRTKHCLLQSWFIGEP
uniref:Uncharacterized protein n=1 Tax=Bubo bubo TaxID=30461 RepID=A0A8C0ERE9_BUBBB